LTKTQTTVNFKLMKTSEGVKLEKWILDMLFSIKFSTIHTKNAVDNSIGSWNITIQT